MANAGASPYDDRFGASAGQQGVTFGATQVIPQSNYAQSPQSAYQPYGQPTAHSAAYDQWANQTPGKDFDMNRGKKKGCKRPVIIVLIVLLVILLGLGIGAFLFLGHLDSIMGLGSRDSSVKMALSEPRTGEPYYVLLLVSDSREGAAGSDAEWAEKQADGSDGQSDVMILARIDEKNKLVTLLTIPRDTPWQFPDGHWGKLNQVYEHEGADGAIKAVSEVTGAPISHYAEIHLSGFMNLVDTVGGITVDVPVAIDYHEALTSEEVHLDPGVQRLNGVQAEVFAREREAYGDDQEMKRQSNVRTIVEAIFKEAKSKPVNELPGIITECAKCVTTEITSGEMIFIMSALGGDPTIYSGTGPYAGDINPYADEAWMCFVDPEGWERVMGVVNNGGDPSEVSYEGDAVYIAGSR